MILVHSRTRMQIKSRLAHQNKGHPFGCPLFFALKKCALNPVNSSAYHSGNKPNLLTFMVAHRLYLCYSMGSKIARVINHAIVLQESLLAAVAKMRWRPLWRKKGFWSREAGKTGTVVIGKSTYQGCFVKQDSTAIPSACCASSCTSFDTPTTGRKHALDSCEKSIYNGVISVMTPKGAHL